MKTSEIILTDAAQENLALLKTLLPEVNDVFLVETALQLTASLFKKSGEGAVIQIKAENGKVEELRFKVKKEARKKNRTQSND
jgi:hypothetical protein